MSLSRSRSPRSPRTSVHNCCDVSVPQSERQVKYPHNVLVLNRFHFSKWLLIILQVRWWRMSEVSPGISWLHQPQPLLQISVREAPWSVGGWGCYPREHSRNIWIFPPHYLTLVTNLGSITFYADKAIIPACCNTAICSSIETIILIVHIFSVRAAKFPINHWRMTATEGWWVMLQR